MFTFTKIDNKNLNKINKYKSVTIIDIINERFRIKNKLKSTPTL
jgi:hypothetical protein